MSHKEKQLELSKIQEIPYDPVTFRTGRRWQLLVLTMKLITDDTMVRSHFLSVPNLHN
jgi:hypothetical protein